MKTRVVGCPKTIDGDLKCKEVPTSFGFDTACKVLTSLWNCFRIHISCRLNFDQCFKVEVVSSIVQVKRNFADFFADIFRNDWKCDG